MKKTLFLALIAIISIFAISCNSSEMPQTKEEQIKIKTKDDFSKEITCETEEQCAEEAVRLCIENPSADTLKLSCKAVIDYHGYYAGIEVYEGIVTCAKKRYRFSWHNGAVFVYPIP